MFFYVCAAQFPRKHHGLGKGKLFGSNTSFLTAPALFSPKTQIYFSLTSQAGRRGCGGGEGQTEGFGLHSELSLHPPPSWGCPR